MTAALDFATLPPEINSARMYSGAGSAPMLAAASAWHGLSAELRASALSYSSVLSTLTGEEWHGPASASMTAAAAPYVAWMSVTAVRAEQAGAQAEAAQAKIAAGVYETAFAATVPPPVIEANRALLMSLVATNIFGHASPRRPVPHIAMTDWSSRRAVTWSNPRCQDWAEFGFDVDTYDGAVRLQQHLQGLAGGPLTSAAATVVVVGAGLTGIETACELPGRLHALFARGDGVTPRVVLIDHNPFVGSDMGLSARPVIEQALLDNGVETRTGVSVAAVSPGGVTLSSGERLAAARRPSASIAVTSAVTCATPAGPSTSPSGMRQALRSAS